MTYTLQQRFDEKWIPEPNSNCWLWTASVNKQGYGHIGVGGKVLLAHRISWFLHHGEMPPSNLDVCHHCDTPGCVNPKHLFVGTVTDNLYDCIDKGRRKYRLNNKNWEAERKVNVRQRVFVCKRGHDRSGLNLYIKPNGTIHCKACARERLKEKRKLERV